MKNLKKIGEGDLISLVQKGDGEAFQEFYERYHKLVYYVAFKMCHNDADAQDVVQETFVEMRRSIKDLQKPSFFRLWMYRIINSKCKKLFRKNKYSYTELERDDIQYSFLENRKDFVPNNEMRYQNDHELLQLFIDRLPQAQRMMIIMFYMEQMTSAEIAKVCDVSEGTVKSRLFTARNTLKKDIEEYEKREGISLNFHDLSSALTASFAAQVAITGSVGVTALKQGKGSFHNSITNLIQANAFVAKLAVITCASTVAVSGAYVAYQNTQQPKEPEILEKGQYQSTFPTIEYKGENISNGKDAYYTLKMNYTKQDIKNLDLSTQPELKNLYQALKNENGVYYKRLQETGWILE